MTRWGARTLLRELRQDDVDAVHGIYGDPEATRHLSFEPRSRADVARLVERLVRDPSVERRTEYCLAVGDRAGGDLIGVTRLALGEHRSGQVGIALRPDRWGRGLGGEALDLLLSLGFDDLGLHRIWGARSPENEASARLMLAAGMAQEGVIRHHVHVRGSWRDSVVHAILEPEWRERQDRVRGRVAPP